MASRGSVNSPSPMNFLLIVICIYAYPALGSQSGLVNASSAHSLAPLHSVAGSKNESAQSSGHGRQKSGRPAEAVNTADSRISAVASGSTDPPQQRLVDVSFSAGLAPQPAISDTANQLEESRADLQHKSWRGLYFAPPPADADASSNSGISAVADASFSPGLSPEPAVSGTQNQLEETGDLQHKSWREFYFRPPPDGN